MHQFRNMDGVLRCGHFCRQTRNGLVHLQKGSVFCLTDVTLDNKTCLRLHMYIFGNSPKYLVCVKKY